MLGRVPAHDFPSHLLSPLLNGTKSLSGPGQLGAAPFVFGGTLTGSNTTKIRFFKN
jgi:hypothetical protein